MRQHSHVILPSEPGYTAHREAARRRDETARWLRRRERALREHSDGPSLVPQVGAGRLPEREKQRVN